MVDCTVDCSLILVTNKTTNRLSPTEVAVGEAVGYTRHTLDECVKNLQKRANVTLVALRLRWLVKDHLPVLLKLQWWPS